MKFVEWCRLFELKHEDINRQHMELFNITNQFYMEFLAYQDAAYSGIKQDMANRLFINTLNKLIKYAQEHFTFEEGLLAKNKCPEEHIKRHSQIHERLMEDIFNLSAKFSKDTTTGIQEVETFLIRWLVLHVLIEDRKHNSCL